MDAFGCLVLPDSGTASTTKNALIVLDDPFPNRTTLQALLPLWDVMDLVVVADGAANFVYDLLIQGKEDTETSSGGRKNPKDCIPHAICGDWDSIRPEVEQFFRSKNVALVKDVSQDDNDLWKCLKEVENRQSQMTSGESTQDSGSTQHDKYAVYVYCSLGGRLDHSMQSLNALFCWKDTFRSLTVMNSCSLAMLLPPGETTVTLRPPFEGPTVGLLPVGQPVQSLTTRGLKWDVTNWSTRMGSVISSSNRISADEGELYKKPASQGQSRTVEVHVKTSDPIVWVSSINSDMLDALVQ